jgi:hypothetical protein
MNTKFWSENLNGRVHLEDKGVDGRIILGRKLEKLCGKLWTGFIWLRQEPMVGSCERGNEPLSSIKGGEFLD